MACIYTCRRSTLQTDHTKMRPLPLVFILVLAAAVIVAAEYEIDIKQIKELKELTHEVYKPFLDQTQQQLETAGQYSYQLVKEGLESLDQQVNKIVRVATAFVVLATLGFVAAFSVAVGLFIWSEKRKRIFMANEEGIQLMSRA